MLPCLYNVGWLFVREKITHLSCRRGLGYWEKISFSNWLYSNRIWPPQINCINCKLSPPCCFLGQLSGLRTWNCKGHVGLMSSPRSLRTFLPLVSQRYWYKIFWNIVEIPVFSSWSSFVVILPPMGLALSELEGQGSVMCSGPFALAKSCSAEP